LGWAGLGLGIVYARVDFSVCLTATLRFSHVILKHKQNKGY